MGEVIRGPWGNKKQSGPSIEPNGERPSINRESTDAESIVMRHAKVRALRMLDWTKDCNLKEANDQKEYFKKNLQPIEIASRIIGVLDDDIHDDAPLYRGLALALLSGDNGS